MTEVVRILRTVAEELVEMAKSSMPKIREGEKICREWFCDGVYSRETTFKDKTFLAQFDFRQRKLTRFSPI